MSFQLKSNESVGTGIKRCVRHELEKILKSVAPEKPGSKAETDAVHEIRKRFKKMRAALRLVREDLGDDIYHQENFCYRDAAKPLTAVRDAEMLVETVEKIRQQFADKINPQDLAKILSALNANQCEVTRRVLHKEKALPAVKEEATRALARLLEWRIDRNGWEALAVGLRRVYRQGHRALNLATEKPSVANLHEWRKQTKYLWHALQLLESAWKNHEKDLADEVHHLSRLLGEDHDLAVLRQVLAADPAVYGGHRFLKSLFVIIDHSREELERQAFELGQRLYKDPAKIFTARLESYWKASKPEINPVKKQIPNRLLSVGSKGRLSSSGPPKQRNTS